MKLIAYIVVSIGCDHFETRGVWVPSYGHPTSGHLVTAIRQVGTWLRPSDKWAAWLRPSDKWAGNLPSLPKQAVDKDHDSIYKHHVIPYKPGIIPYNSAIMGLCQGLEDILPLHTGRASLYSLTYVILLSQYHWYM